MSEISADRGLYRGTAEKHAFPAVRSAESSDFPRIIREMFPLFHEYLSQRKTKFENIFRLSSGAYEVLIQEKTTPKNLMLQSF
jgi:hypothetical protein